MQVFNPANALFRSSCQILDTNSCLWNSQKTLSHPLVLIHASFLSNLVVVYRFVLGVGMFMQLGGGARPAREVENTNRAVSML